MWDSFETPCIYNTKPKDLKEQSICAFHFSKLYCIELIKEVFFSYWRFKTVNLYKRKMPFKRHKNLDFPPRLFRDHLKFGWAACELENCNQWVYNHTAFRVCQTFIRIDEKQHLTIYVFGCENKLMKIKCTSKYTLGLCFLMSIVFSLNFFKILVNCECVP